MINVSDSIVIGKPLAEVFAFASDVCKIPDWQKSVKSIEAPDEPVVKGSQFVMVRKFMGQEMKTPFEVLKMDLNSGISIKSKSGPVKIQVNMNFEDAIPNTRVTTNLEAEVGGFFKVAEGMVAKQMKTQISEDDRELKTLLEKM